MFLLFMLYKPKSDNDFCLYLGTLKYCSKGGSIVLEVLLLRYWIRLRTIMLFTVYIDTLWLNKKQKLYLKQGFFKECAEMKTILHISRATMVLKCCLSSTRLNLPDCHRCFLI
jgi:hypothetical protein